MSGIYIPGMDMPNHCGRCPFWDEVMYRRSGTCTATDKVIMCQYDNRPENCPLIQVPDHGRLIDADALMLRINMHGTNKFGMLDEDIRQFVDAAPTILDAEEGEE